MFLFNFSSASTITSFLFDIFLFLHVDFMSTLFMVFFSISFLLSFIPPLNLSFFLTFILSFFLPFLLSIFLSYFLSYFLFYFPPLIFFLLSVQHRFVTTAPWWIELPLHWNICLVQVWYYWIQEPILSSKWIYSSV